MTLPLLKEGIKVTAVDISSKSLDSLRDIAVRMNIKKNRLSLAPAIPKKKWEAIVGCDILHHVPLDKTLSEIRSYLNEKKGIIVFSEPNIFNPSWAIFVTLFHSWKIEGGMINCHYYNFIRELKLHDFHRIHLHGYGLIPPPLLNKIPFFQRINYFLGNLPVIKFFAYRYILTAQAK